MRLALRAAPLRRFPPRAGTATSRWWAAVMVAMVGGVLLCGAATVVRFHVWAELDERAHYAYVQEIAEQGRLPRIGDLVSPEVQAITENRWPRPPLENPAQLGIAGRNYEAFQPPLYYVLAVPAFAAVDDHRAKAFALRAFDLALVAVACALLFRLASRELPEAPHAAFAGALGVVLLPGVLVRGVTISNLPLELVLATALLLALHHAWREHQARWLPIAGLILGACLLTKLTLVYLAVPFMMALWHLRHAAGRRTLAASIVAPVVVLAPWLISNLVRLGTLTANAAARAQQEPFLFPGGNHLGLGDLPAGLWRLAEGALPQEWHADLDLAWVRVATLTLLATILAGGAAAVLGHRSTPLARMSVAGFAAFVAVAAVALVAARWDVFLLRYAYPVLPSIGAIAAAHFWRRAGDRATLTGAAAWVVVVAVLWIHFAGQFYFTDLGNKLGI